VFLLVGGLSMMNIMLLVGHRRRREIALRRAEGARRLDIFLQFLCEGKAIALVGLVFGTMAGMLIAVVRVWIDPNAIFAVTVPWFDVFESWAALVVVALIACSIPAWRATRFHPAELLRESR